MAMLPYLLELSLSECQLHNIGPSIKYVNFDSLVSLDLSMNLFNSELPYWLFNLSSEILYIDLSTNYLQGQILRSLLDLRNLKVLYFHENKFNRSILDWLDHPEHI